MLNIISYTTPVALALKMPQGSGQLLDLIPMNLGLPVLPLVVQIPGEVAVPVWLRDQLLSVDQSQYLMTLPILEV